MQIGSIFHQQTIKVNPIKAQKKMKILSFVIQLLLVLFMAHQMKANILNIKALNRDKIEDLEKNVLEVENENIVGDLPVDDNLVIGML